MNKPFSTKAILINILILFLSILAILGAFMTYNGILINVAIDAFFIMSLISLVYYSKKRKISNTPQPQPTTPYGAAIQPKVSNKSVILEVFLIISALVEIYFVATTVWLFVNPSPISIGAIITVPVCIINGGILVALIVACFTERK